MDIPSFQIPTKRFTGESTVISCRLPKDMLKELDRVAAATGRTRNEIVSMSLEFALEHMAPVEEEETEQKIKLLK